MKVILYFMAACVICLIALIINYFTHDKKH